LVQRSFFAIVAKQDPFKEEWIRTARSLVDEWLTTFLPEENHSLPQYTDWKSIPDGQPFLLHMLHGLLDTMGDADSDFIPQFIKGVPLGILHPIIGNRAIFDEKTKWKLSLDPLLDPVLENPNYVSLKDHIEEVERQFKEEELEGLMKEMSNADFANQFGNNSAISALAVIEEPGKIRVLLDATHATQVNHRIRCPDQICVPGVREIHTLLNEYLDSKTVPLALLADISKAHRRYKHLPDEQGYLGCRLRDHSVWINLCGTFGIACAAYWWSRLMGALTRCIHGILGPSLPLELLVYVDDLQFIAGDRRERKAVVFAIFLFRMLGVPFKVPKFRGGFKVDWIGLHICFKTYSVGLSPERAAWMVSWIRKILAQGWVETREMAMGLGRLNFAVSALIFEKPFLGILYMWTSTIISSDKRVASIPWAVRLILQWIGERLSSSNAMQRVLPATNSTEDWFRSDAKAEDGRATIGGWECIGNTPPHKARWFFVEVEQSWAPWAFSKKKDPKRVIATLELLGTLLCLMLFRDRITAGRSGTICVAGGTDNAGNTFAMNKLMSTKWPLTVLLIEMAEFLRQSSIQLHLQWVPRESNVEADNLTNEKFEGFNEDLRIHVDGANLPWLVLPRIMAQSQRLFEEVLEQRSKNKLLPSSFCSHGHTAKSRKRKDPW
jgi:hypothetical protein